MGMRGDEDLQEELFSYGSLSQRVPVEHPLRRVRALADAAMVELGSRFEHLYSKLGRPSVPPEQLLRALLLQLLYSVRSERMLVEQLEYNLLFRWLVALGMSERVWDATSFSKNRERLLQGEVAQAFFAAVVSGAKRQRLLSDEHFTVDGTLIEAWASEKSYQPKPGPPPSKGSGRDGEVLKSDTHGSITDPDARMYRKGLKTGWKLQHMAHAGSENRHGLVVASAVSHCSPKAERQAAIAMLGRLRKFATQRSGPTRATTNRTSSRPSSRWEPRRTCRPTRGAGADAGSTRACMTSPNPSPVRRRESGSNASSAGLRTPPNCARPATGDIEN